MAKRRFLRKFLSLFLLSGITAVSTNAAAPDWKVNANDFKYDMSFYVTLNIDGSAVNNRDYPVAAFINQECRGVGEIVQSEQMAAPVVYMRVYSNSPSGDVVSFILYDSQKDITVATASTQSFKANELVGSPSEPLSLNFIETIVFEGITLNQTSAVLEPGKTVQLSVTPVPAYAELPELTWSSSDTKVATVSNTGLVTAVEEGKAAITVSAGEGISAVCNVTVKNGVVEVTGITLTPATAEILIGGSVTLTATVSPENADDKSITWTSSDTKVATVANGVVTGVGVGTATITAKSSNGITAQSTVKVNPVECTSVTLDKAEYVGEAGTTLQLTATVLPAETTDPTVTWTSSDAAVATVDSKGRVTLVTAGSATITATCGSKSATCKLTVKAKVVECASVTLDKTEYEGEAGTTLQLTATVLPAETTDSTVTWTSSDAAVATVDSKGLVTLMAPGSATITATCGSKSATCKIICTDDSGVETILKDGTEFTIYTLDGVKVAERAGKNDLNKLEKGIYILQTVNGNIKIRK